MVTKIKLRERESKQKMAEALIIALITHFKIPPTHLCNVGSRSRHLPHENQMKRCKKILESLTTRGKHLTVASTITKIILIYMI